MSTVENPASLNIACPVCGGGLVQVYPSQISGAGPMHRCAKCGFHTVVPMPNNVAEAYDEWHVEGEDKQNRVTADDYFEKVRKYLPSGSHRFLEVGGAFGWFAERVRKDFGADVFLLEPSRPAVNGAIARGIPAHAGFIEKFEAEKPFDVVFAAHVVEHVSDVDEFWRACHRLLKPGGRMILLTPNASAWKLKAQGGKWGWAAADCHTLFLNPDSARRLMARHGFNEVAIRGYSPHIMHYPFVFIRWLAAMRSKRIRAKAAAAAAAPVSQSKAPVQWVKTRGIKRLLTRPLVWAELAILRTMDALFGSDRKDELLIVAEKRKDDASAQ